MSPTDKVTILLVDDQPAKLLSYELILADLGETLIKAGSATEALAELLRNEVAVILTDVSMPELDGFELARMIRDHPRFERTAIIFVSAIHMTELDLLKGYSAGAVDYVSVPVVPELLRAKVKVFAELYRKTRQLEQLNGELESRVAQRTAELAEANTALEQRVEQRTREREAALAQLHEMQKMESLGQLTGGVAHDFNNLLMAIMGNLALLKKRLPSDSPLQRLVQGATEGAERGATLTKRMLAFARRQELKPVAVDLGQLIEGFSDMLRRSLGPAIRLEVALQPGLPAVRVDPNQLELALLNLGLNAKDAMPEGGRLDIRASYEPTPEGLSELPPGEFVCLALADSGSGMDETTLRRATEPFFTTKGVGKGTGLGLPMVHGLAVQSGGAMRIASRLGEGTIIRLWLPVAHEVPETGASVVGGSVDGEQESGGTAACRVLIVDDDPLVVASTSAMLEDLGHVVLEASSAERALDVLRVGAKVDLVITDHAMPGMTGFDLAQMINRNWPGIPVVLASGYADLPELPGYPMMRLAKPFKQAELATCVHRAIGSGNVICMAAHRA